MAEKEKFYIKKGFITMKDKLRVGLVGIGRGTSYGHIFSVNPLTEVAALCDFDENKLARSGKD